MEGVESRQCRKRKESGEIAGEEEEKLTKTPAISGGDEIDDVEKLEIEDGTVVEVMKWLEQEITCTSSSASSYYQSPSFVTINGNEETCGPSFSDYASTVMATIDTRGVFGVSCFTEGPTDAAIGRVPTVEIEPWCTGSGEDGKMWPAPETAGEDEENDDEWLARVVGGAFEMEESLLVGSE